MTKRNKTLEEILDVIFYNNPSTQDEIAEELGISRRYVTKLLKPLIDQDIVKRAYILDMDKLHDAKEDLAILHPLPRVNEIAVEVDDDPRAKYFDQVLCGRFIRMALILRLLEIK